MRNAARLRLMFIAAATGGVSAVSHCPEAASSPVTIRQPLVLDSELIDYYCLENEKDWAHMKNGK